MVTKLKLDYNGDSACWVLETSNEEHTKCVLCGADVEALGFYCKVTGDIYCTDCESKKDIYKKCYSKQGKIKESKGDGHQHYAVMVSHMRLL